MPAAPDDCRIAPLLIADIEPLNALAHEIWHQHYPGIITVKQIEYMLEQRYSPDTIRAEIESDAARWVKLLVNGELGGFASYEADGARRAVKLDKLYVHRQFRDKGCGAAQLRRRIRPDAGDRAGAHTRNRLLLPRLQRRRRRGESMRQRRTLLRALRARQRTVRQVGDPSGNRLGCNRAAA